MKVLLVVEDDPDIRMLVRFNFASEPDFEIDGEAATAEAAITIAAATRPDLVVLDYKLEGEMTGLQAAPMLKVAAPHAVILLFSASEELRVPAKDEPTIDAFVLKTEITKLVSVARKLLGV